MNYILIVAGGKGLRMGGDMPKQFLPIHGKPVLMRTMEAFRAADPALCQILVLPRQQQDYWRQLCADYAFDLPHRVADGGETRFHSVKNGLQLVDDRATLVGVHDGVRPFVSAEVIRRCYALAATCRAVVPVVDVVETLRRLEPDGKSLTVPRDAYRLVQTPQVFDAGVLRQAYAQDYLPEFTDDASVVEALGIPVTLTQGNRENIKLTTPFDLKVALSLATL